MRSLIYSFVLAFSITFVWFLQITFDQSFYVLEITSPPSPYGPPEICLRTGSSIKLIRFSRETYLSEPQPRFVDEYRIPSASADEIRVVSNLPPDRINQISARLLDLGGTPLATWNYDSFQPTPVEQVKKDQPFDVAPADVFALGKKLEFSARPPPAHQLSFLLELLFAQAALSACFCTLFRFLPLYRNLLRRIFRTLRYVPLSAENRRPFALALTCLLVTSAISTVIWFVFGIYYGTIDDPLMTLVANGYLLRAPDWHLFFIHPLIGLILSDLYRAIPHAPWYNLFMVSVNTLSISAIAYSVLRRSFQLYRILLFSMLILISGIYLIACVQFTMVSTMACCAGAVLILGNVGQLRISRARLSVAIIFFLLGTAVRFQPALLVIALTGPCAFYLWIRSSLPGARQFTLAVFTGIFLLNLSETSAYRSSPEWQEAKSYDTSRGILNGTQFMKQYEDNAGVFQAVGWSRNDLQMFNDGLYEDAIVYSAEKLRYLVSHLRPPSINLTKSVWVLFCDLFPNFPEVVFFLVCLVFVLAWPLMPRLQAVMLIVPCLSALGYLAINIRLPCRVLCPALFTEMALFLLFVAPENFRVRLRTALFGSIIFTLLYVVLIIQSVSGIYRFGQYSDLRQHSTVDALAYFSRPGAPVILNTICGTSADQTFLWRNFPELQQTNLVQLAWFQSPIYNQRMARFGIGDVFSDLYRRDDVVLAVQRWDFNQLTEIETFLRERRGVRVKFELAKIPGTDKDAVFSFFSFFRATLDPGAAVNP